LKKALTKTLTPKKPGEKRNDSVFFWVAVSKTWLKHRHFDLMTMSWDVFVTSTHLAPNDLVIHLFVAILVLESYEGRGLVVEHTLEG